MEVSVNQLARGQEGHGLQLQSPVSGTRGWVLPHPALLGILCFAVCMHKTIIDGNLCNHVQLSLTQKLNSCLARNVGSLTLEQIVRSAEGSKV